MSLEEADAEEAGEGEEVIPEVEGVEEVEDIGEDDADVFLEEDEEEDEDLDFDVGERRRALSAGGQIAACVSRVRLRLGCTRFGGATCRGASQGYSGP